MDMSSCTTDIWLQFHAAFAGLQEVRCVRDVDGDWPQHLDHLFRHMAVRS